MDDIATLKAALVHARARIAEDRQEFFEGALVPGSEADPYKAMEPDEREHLLRYDALLAEIDAALK